jgi:hypothetical protein
MKQLAGFLFALHMLPLASCALKGAGMPRLRHPISYSGTGAGSMIEGQRSVTGRILLPPPTEYEEPSPIVVTSSGAKIEAGWPERDQAAHLNKPSRGQSLVSLARRKVMWAQAVSKIDPSQEYRIELLTGIYTNPSEVNNDILRVTKGDQVVIDSSICQVHKLPMRRQIEDSCSSEDYSTSFFLQRKKEFPNDGTAYLGCGSGLSFPTWKCPECSRQCDAWMMKHGK